MVSDGKRERGGEQAVATVNGRINRALYVPVATADDLAGQGPGPMMPLEAATKTANVQVGIRHQRRVILVRRRSLAEEITGTQIISVTQLTCDAEFIEEARVPVQRQRSDLIDNRAL